MNECKQIADQLSDHCTVLDPTHDIRFPSTHSESGREFSLFVCHCYLSELRNYPLHGLRGLGRVSLVPSEGSPSPESLLILHWSGDSRLFFTSPSSLSYSLLRSFLSPVSRMFHKVPPLPLPSSLRPSTDPPSPSGDLQYEPPWDQHPPFPTTANDGVDRVTVTRH